MKNRREWTGLYSELYKRLADIAEDCGINIKHKSFPANAIGLSKRITAIKSNLENVGINCEPEKRNKLGHPISLKRANSSTPFTPSALTAENGALSGVLNGEDKRGGGVSAPLTSPNNTPDKPSNYGVCADGDYGVDKNGSLTEVWYSVAEDISDEDIPPEFLKPSPPSTPRNEQLKL